MISQAKITQIENVRHSVSTIVAPAICNRAYQALLLFSDAAMLLIAFALAYWLRFSVKIAVSNEVEASLGNYMSLGFKLIPVWVAFFALLGLYRMSNLLNGTHEYAQAVLGCTAGMMLVVVVNFLAPEFVIARGWLIMSWLGASILICTNRFFLRRIAHALRAKGYFITSAVIVGTNEEAESLAKQLNDSNLSGLQIVGFVDENDYDDRDPLPKTFSHWPILGTLDNLSEVLHHTGATEVIIATTALSREQRLSTAQQLISLPGVTMSLSSGLYEIFTTGMTINTKGSVPLMSLNRLRLDSIEVSLKRLLDYGIIFAALPFLLPTFLLIALLVKLDSSGPVFYRRRVLGVGGKPFDAFKFRSMVINGDEVLAQNPELLAELKANQKLKSDPRVTRMGNLLRKTSLDELPQLINVLFGQMSLVGPRMISPEEAPLYGPMKQNLLTVKPGLTGLWQVSGRSDLSYNERVQLDMHYIRNYSIWSDLKILFVETLPAVFKSRGAY